MDLDAVVARLLATGAATGNEPETLAVALAATGALAALDADLGRAPALHAPPTGPQPVIPTVPWRDPTLWLDRVGETAAVAVDWWDAGVAVDPLPPDGGVRLLVLDEAGHGAALPLDALELLSQVPHVAAVTLAAKVTDTPPPWTWPLRVASAPSWPAVPRRLAEQRPPSWWETLVVPVDTAGPWAVASLALLDPGADELDDADEPVRATAVVLAGDPTAPPPTAELLDVALRHACGLVAVVRPDPDRDTWLIELVTQLSHDVPLDVALHRAGPALVLAAPAVPGRLRARSSLAVAIARGGVVRPGRPVRGERLLDAALHGMWASEITDASSSAEDMRAERSRGRRETDRFLHAEFRRRGEPVTEIAPDTGHDLAVWIGAGTGPVPFPDELLAALLEDTDPTSAELTVTLTDLTLRPNDVAAAPVRNLRLPPVGDAEPVLFRIRAFGPGALLAYRIVVSHRHRFLQTGVLRATAGDGRSPVFEVETIVRTDAAELATATAHDVELVLNHTDDGTALISALADGVPDGAVAAFATGKVVAELTNVAGLLQSMANRPESFSTRDASPGFGSLMLQLAQAGRRLHNTLFGRYAVLDAAWEPRLRDAARISVLSARPSAVAPLEIVYDGPLADGMGRQPPWCPEAATHLADGACPGTCAPAPGAFVCPFGFWGVRKIIERHAPPLEAGPGARAAAEHPDVERHRVPLTDVFAAASKRADHNDAAAWTSSAGLLGAATLASTWAELGELVQRGRENGRPPQVVMLVPHVARRDGSELLEIGEGDELPVLGGWAPLVVRPDELDAEPTADESADRRSPYADNPLVMVLGCGTAGLGREMLAPSAQFLESGAPAVVSTLAVVLGRDIVPVGVALLDELRRAAAGGGRDSLLGSAMRAARRRCLADGQAAVLALVSFGDTDWQLVP